MGKTYRSKKLITFAAAVFILPGLFATSAFAAPFQSSKGAVAAESTRIDRSTYTDASLYLNAPTEVSTVKIGLSYGGDAVDEAEFINPAGKGFIIGVYGADREFTGVFKVNDSHITVRADDEDREFGQLYICNTKNGAVLYAPKNGKASVAFIPESGSDGLTQYGKDRFRGGFECILGENGRLTVINYVGLEDYVKGVIPYEMSYIWPYEALRAQAVCARTYVVYNLNEYEEQGFDITGDTYSQMYRGVLQADKITDAAVDSTAGQLVRYKGEICEIYYFAADGGATEDGACMFDSDRPYLIGKADPFELAQGSPYDGWTTWRSGDQLAARLNKLGYEIGDITEISPEYSDRGNVISVSLSDEDGNSLYFTGRECYSALGLNSCRYTVEYKKDEFLFYGSGLGHSCGLSQWGAYAMAEDYGYNYDDIIRFYFTGAYIA